MYYELIINKTKIIPLIPNFLVHKTQSKIILGKLFAKFVISAISKICPKNSHLCQMEMNEIGKIDIGMFFLEI